MAVKSIYNPISFIDELSNEMTRLFDVERVRNEDGVATWRPSVDILGDEKQYTLRADLPGVDPDAVEIEVDDGVLTLKGSREESRDETEINFSRYERITGRFMRRFTLPDAVDVDKISARSVNGVLEITIPKHPKLEPKRIKVSTK